MTLRVIKLKKSSNRRAAARVSYETWWFFFLKPFSSTEISESLYQLGAKGIFDINLTSCFKTLSENQSLCNSSLGTWLNLDPDLKHTLKEADGPAVWTGLLCVCAAAQHLLDSTVSPGPPDPTGSCRWSSHREMPPVRAPPAGLHCCWSRTGRGQTG